jgi:hypothetical protein
VQENQQLRSDAAIAATEAEDRRRAAELEKAKAEIERCDSIVFLGKKGLSLSHTHTQTSRG